MRTFNGNQFPAHNPHGNQCQTKTRLARDRLTTIVTHPERSLLTALGALQRGCTLGRPMTQRERYVLAVTSTGPTHRLDLTTETGTTHDELANAFTLLVPRIEREKGRGRRPLIYVGTFARGQGDGGYHMHLLLWEYPYLPVWKGHLRDVGIGLVKSVPIAPSRGASVLPRVAYALAQHEPVFGTDVHEHHRPREKYKRSLVSPQRETLRVHSPELFRVTDLAKDKSVSDIELFRNLPMFIEELRPALKEHWEEDGAGWIPAQAKERPTNKN